LLQQYKLLIGKIIVKIFFINGEISQQVLLLFPTKHIYVRLYIYTLLLAHKTHRDVTHHVRLSTFALMMKYLNLFWDKIRNNFQFCEYIGN